MCFRLSCVVFNSLLLLTIIDDVLLTLPFSKLIRGHCVFWAVDTEVPFWVKKIPDYDLKEKLQTRLKSLLGRYKGRSVKFSFIDISVHTG